MAGISLTPQARDDQGRMETVDRIVTMSEKQVIVEFDELWASVLDVKEEDEECS